MVTEHDIRPEISCSKVTQLIVIGLSSAGRDFCVEIPSWEVVIWSGSTAIHSCSLGRRFGELNFGALLEEGCNAAISVWR